MVQMTIFECFTTVFIMSENNVANICRFHNHSFPVIKLLICQIDIDESKQLYPIL